MDVKHKNAYRLIENLPKMKEFLDTIAKEGGVSVWSAELPRFLLLYAETCCGGNFGSATLQTPHGKKGAFL